MNDNVKFYQLTHSYPFLPRGAIYAFDMETGVVYRVENGKANEYPLRFGLSGYLWLLMSDRDKHMIPINADGTLPE